MPIADEQRRKCNDIAFHCYGTAYVFEKRAANIQLWLTILTFLGIAGPATLGAVLSNFSMMINNTNVVLYIAGGIALFQLILSIWALSASWSNNLSSYYDSKLTNYRLAERFYELGNSTIYTEDEFNLRLTILEKEDELREAIDSRFDISDKEKRKGRRAALWKYKRECDECGMKPTSLKSSNCPACGNF